MRGTGYSTNRRGTSHLLCSYKLWVDGVPLGAGPGRIVGDAIDRQTGRYTYLLPPLSPFLCLITPLCSYSYGGLYGGPYERAHIIRYFPRYLQVSPAADPRRHV